MIDSAYRVEDLRVPPGNKLHALKGDRAGQHSISINDQWRICFRFEGEDAFEVEFAIITKELNHGFRKYDHNFP